MSLTSSIIKAFRKKWECGWDEYPKMYWAIDLHGVILNSTYRADFKKQIINPVCLRVLKRLSEKENACLILFTASHVDYVSEVLKWFREIGIFFDYVNENPEISNNEWYNANKKFYFDILFDDKAGFDMDTDWMKVEKVMESIDQF